MMNHHGTRIKVLDRLLASLAEAHEGSRELDVIVSFALGKTLGEAGKMAELLVEEGYTWDIVSEILDHDLPAYTTSLDAALPGENIVLSVYSTRRRLWGAAHRIADGQHVMRWAASECLARRLAALSALAPAEAETEADAPPKTTKIDELKPSDEAAPADEAATPPENQVQTEERAETDEEEAEWKILF
jgi:hypothetical protein